MMMFMGNNNPFGNMFDGMFDEPIDGEEEENK